MDVDVDVDECGFMRRWLCKKWNKTVAPFEDRLAMEFFFFEEDFFEDTSFLVGQMCSKLLIRQWWLTWNFAFTSTSTTGVLFIDRHGPGSNGGTFVTINGRRGWRRSRSCGCSSCRGSSGHCSDCRCGHCWCNTGMRSWSWSWSTRFAFKWSHYFRSSLSYSFFQFTYIRK